MKKHHFKLASKSLILWISTSLLILLFTHPSQALLPYKYSWIRIKTPHFTIIVKSDLKEYGQTVANKAEEAFSRLQKFTTKHPENTYIIVDHTKGFSNGSATFFPYPIIKLQPITPDSYSSVGQYKDWLLELLIHEYTHILTFHNTKGLFKPFRWLLGSTVSPGYFQPTWYQEGVAVYTESHLSNGGRLRSSLYSAYKKELKAFNVALANEQGTNLYPFGSAPYIYGGWLNQDLLGTDNLISASKLHHKLSGRLPYTINGAYKRLFGTSVYKSWNKLFNRKKEVTHRPESKTLGTLPHWDEKNQNLYFSQLDPFSFDKIIKQDKSGTQTVLLKSRNIIQIKPFSDDIYYLALRLHKRDHQVYSLYKFNSKTKKTLRLKTNKNIKNFDISKAGLVLATASLKQQSIDLFKNFNFEDQINWSDSIKVFSSDGETRLAHPLFLNAETVAYTKKAPGKNEVIYTYNFSTHKESNFFSAEHIVDLKQYKGSAWALYENQGQKELVQLSSQQKFKVDNGIQQISPKEDSKFIVSNISHKGFFLSEKNLNDLKVTGNNGLKIPQYQIYQEEKHKYSDKGYSSFSKLLPHYIMPNFAVSPYGFSGEFLYGISIGGQDPLRLHSYAAALTTDTISNQLSYGLKYTSNHFRLPVEINGGVFYEPITLDFFTKSTYTRLSTSFPLNLGFSNRLNFRLSALLNSTSNDFPEAIDTDGDGLDDTIVPGSFITIENKRAGVSANFSYNRSETRVRELAPRKGYSLGFGATHYIDDGEYLGYTQSFAGFRKFFTSPLNKKHRIIIGLDGQKNDRQLPRIFATSSQNQLYRNINIGGLALRGLPTSSIAASKSFIMGHFEYRLPLVNINWGPGLLPGFFQRITAAVTADYGSVEGFDRISGQSLEHSTPLYSAGAELVFEGNAFYHVPASLQLGMYKFLNADLYDSSPELFIGFGLSGLPF